MWRKLERERERESMVNTKKGRCDLVVWIGRLVEIDETSLERHGKVTEKKEDTQQHEGKKKHDEDTGRYLLGVIQL